MAWFGGKKTYDRTKILAQARRAAARRAHTRAIALYERVREVEPGNAEILRKLAIQRAKARQPEEAWRDCRLAAEVLLKKGFVEQAIGVLREFASVLPQKVEVWHGLAELELKRNRRPDALAVLVEGHRAFRSRRHRADAISLLRRARDIDPTHFEAGFELAGLLARTGGTPTARRILRDLAPYARSRRNLRRLRGRQFRLSPTPGAAWSWLVAVLGGAPPPVPRARRA